MGFELGALSMLVYVLLGIAGLPFFSGMSSGIEVVLGPTGGFIIGFMIAAWVVGRLCHGERPSWARVFLALAAGSCVVYAFGVSVDPLLLDIFKIWLGAAIGISVNALQKTETK